MYWFPIQLSLSMSFKIRSVVLMSFSFSFVRFSLHNALYASTTSGSIILWIYVLSSFQISLNYSVVDILLSFEYHSNLSLEMTHICRKFVFLSSNREREKKLKLKWRNKKKQYIHTWAKLNCFYYIYFFTQSYN